MINLRKRDAEARSIDYSLPPGTNDWAWLLVRSLLKEPLKPAIDEIPDKDVVYMIAFIEGMQDADWGDPPDPGNF